MDAGSPSLRTGSFSLLSMQEIRYAEPVFRDIREQRSLPVCPVNSDASVRASFYHFRRGMTVVVHCYVELIQYCVSVVRSPT